MENTLLKVSGLTVTFDSHKVLDDISFEVKEDETLAIIGPNGAGKSVLFRALLGLVSYQGTIVWKDDVKIGYVPQKLAIPKDVPLTVSEFFTFKEKDRNEVKRVLASVGFDSGEPKGQLGTLSGGELQRVLIAYALLGRPDVLLFDEPTSGVDVSAEETIYDLLHKLQEKENMTIILISHELQVVYRYADQVLCLNKEKVCFGLPGEVLDKESLKKLYGGDVKFYHHHD